MREAIISDIHGNLAALLAVLEDIKTLGIDRLVCLGDLVGYYMQPNEVIATVREAVDQYGGFILPGNHDYVALDPEEHGAEFIKSARKIITVTNEELSEENLGFLKELCNGPHHMQEGDMVYVHGSPTGPLWEYIPDSIVDVEGRFVKGKKDFNVGELNAKDHFKCDYRVALVGHSHNPGMLLLMKNGSGEIVPTWLHREGYSESLVIPKTVDAKHLICVGSVGQPRERYWDLTLHFGFNEACYVVRDERSVTWRKVPYDIEATTSYLQKFAEARGEGNYSVWRYTINRLRRGT